MTTLCTLQNLHLTFPHKTIFKNAHFTLDEGDRIGVLGLNGHGKSTLFNVLAEKIKPDHSTPAFNYDKNQNYSYFLVPQELPPNPGKDLSEYFYYFHPLFLEIKKQLDKISHELSESSDNFDALIEKQSHLYEKLHELGEDRYHNKYLSYLKALDVDINTPLEKMSGGEQRKVALSLGLSAYQKVIFWDEPTNHLDIETIDFFEEELQNSDKTFLIISHDRNLLNNVAQRIVHIQHGQIRSFKGTYSEYLNYLQEEQKERAKNIDKLSNYQRRETAWISRGAQARRTKSKKRIENYDELKKQIADLKALAHKKVNLNLTSSGRKTKILVELEDVTMSFGSKILFEHLNLTIEKGERLALIGKNGVGKSTLLKLLTGEINPSKGDIKRAHQLSVGLFSQKREVLDPEMTPWDLIGDGNDFVISNTGQKRHVAGYLENFLFSSEEIKRPIKTFSGGEKNRLQLARFMKDAQDLWIFDEPTNDLDLETIGILEEELKSYPGALIIVGHDRAFIQNVTDTCLYLEDGVIERFDGGLGQLEYFLEAKSLEKKLREQEAKKSQQQQQKQKQSGNSKQEKKSSQQIELLQQKIEEKEGQIQKLEQMMSSFDFSDTSQKQLQKLDELKKNIDQAKAQYEELFEKWSELEAE